MQLKTLSQWKFDIRFHRGLNVKMIQPMVAVAEAKLTPTTSGLGLGYLSARWMSHPMA